MRSLKLLRPSIKFGRKRFIERSFFSFPTHFSKGKDEKWIGEYEQVSDVKDLFEIVKVQDEEDVKLLERIMEKSKQEDNQMKAEKCFVSKMKNKELFLTNYIKDQQKRVIERIVINSFFVYQNEKYLKKYMKKEKN